MRSGVVIGSVETLKVVQSAPDGVTDSRAAVARFAAGTRIATAAGEVPVEALREGVRVRLGSGGTAPLVWLGHQRIDCRRHPWPLAVWPIRIAAGAFGRARPCRDLWLSPDHAIFVDGVLMPVRYLVNGASIRQIRVEKVGYWHLELPAHEVILAEGLRVESSPDTGNHSADLGRRGRREQLTPLRATG